MENSVIYATLLYFSLFRFLVILLGGVSIYLGYRLFSIAMSDANQIRDNSQAELEASFGSSSLTLKNAAPGTFFAAFGAIIVIVVLASSPPKFDYRSETDLPNGEQGNTQIDNNKEKPTAGDVEDPRIIKGRTELTLRDFEFPETAEAAHRLGGEYFRRLLQLEEHAVALEPDNPAHLDSLAGLYFLDGRFELALQYQEKAVQNDPGKEEYQKRYTAYLGAME
jgi:tetratricopeptide (TPR) repeat protein